MIDVKIHELKSCRVMQDEEVELIVERISACLDEGYTLSKRSIALLLIQKDEEIINIVKSKQPQKWSYIQKILDECSKKYSNSICARISKAYQDKARDIAKDCMKIKNGKKSNISDFINWLTINPFTGIPLILIVLYFGFYKFVGVFGAGTVVDFIEEHIFDEFLNPKIDDFINSVIPFEWLADLFANEYGIFTLAVKYAVAIIMPIVGCFFIMFSIIEDSGYLPRVSLLMDRAFKKIGLNGRAVIPMTLGFGCDTMATMVSRTLETKRERIIATFLLALAIPCSAQLGVILALLSSNPSALLIWVLFMVFIFVFIGYLTSKILPGKRPDFYMEIPPLRMPRISNVFKKTYTRMYWYFKEILPLFVLASVLIWIGNLTGIFEVLINIMKPFVAAMGLPEEAAKVFLFGFFRRDYGAAGLFDLQGDGVLNGRQLVVASAALTLFVPCIAQFIIMIKERGWKTAVAMGAFIVPFAFVAGYILNRVILLLNINL